MRKTDTGKFIPKNPQKYIGDCAKITYRSSWEKTCMLLYDAHPNILAWGSEVQSIPYLNPITNKWTVYIPDFIVVVDNGKGQRHVELVEIKPLSQVPGHRAVTESGKPSRISKHNLIEQARNEAKWKAAMVFCAKRGWKFQVMTEQTLFGHTKRKGK